MCLVHDSLETRSLFFFILADALVTLVSLVPVPHPHQHRHFLALLSREDSGMYMQYTRTSEYLTQQGWFHDPWLLERRMNFNMLWEGTPLLGHAQTVGGDQEKSKAWGVVG